MGKHQKWIITEAYKKGKRQLGLLNSYTQFFLSQREICRHFKRTGIQFCDIYKSERRLAHKKFIKLENYITKKAEFGNEYVVLTYKGEEKAKFLCSENQEEGKKKPLHFMKVNAFFADFVQAFDKATKDINDDEKRLMLEELFNNIRKYLSI